MDIYEITQVMIIITSGLVFGRLGLAVARRVERRSPDPSATADGERLRAVEEECGLLRREIGELQERQDFTERLLARGGAPDARLPDREPRVTTPH